ncbi:MAG: CusA/CzcA family heavy metal efflux RND transporter [Acidobacteria bacterium]|nr:MAG: CusA/CzcA family heavy metal efflux RND transporter [Acidobacteriota bacterium]
MPQPDSSLLSRIVHQSLRHRGVVIALAILAAGYGAFSLANARYDVFPEFAAKQIEIQTEAPGLSPEQVEQLVTQKIESAVNGAEGLTGMRSSSVQGLSLVTLIFGGRGDVYHDRQLVVERLAGVPSSLPAGAGTPVMTPLTSSTGDLMTIGITSDKLSLVDLRSLADWTIKPRLLAVTGIAKVGVYGGLIREIRVDVDPAALVRYDVAIDDVLAAASRATGVVGAGFIDTPNQRIVLQTQGQAVSADAVAATIVKHDPIASVRLRDVARVSDSAKPPFSAASVMGKPAVVMNLWTQYGANTIETTDAVDAALAELHPMLKHSGVALDATLFRASKFIETATHNIRVSLILGGILVIVVLFLFLGHFRSAIISCSAIPLSLLVAVTVLQQFGYTLNTMTLGGLAIAIGEVVDDAVIGIENILRRLRERGTGLTLHERLSVILYASVEVRSAVIYATFAVIAVFFPILTMSGLSGKLFAPMGVAYIAAILASLVVAISVTPALALILSRGHDAMEQPRPMIVKLREHYESLLERMERRRVIVMIVAVILTVAGLAAVFFLPTQFLPELREAHYLAHFELMPGTSIQESSRIGDIATKKLLELPYVRTVAQRVGRAEADDVFGPQSSEIEIDLKPVSGKVAKVAAGEIEEKLADVPGAAVAIETFLTERINETISGYTTPVVANVFGNDLDALDEAAPRVAETIAKVPGAADVRLESPPGTPLLLVKLKPEALALHGVDPTTALEAVRTAYQGAEAGQIFEGARVTAITVAIDARARTSPADVGDLPIRAATGVFVRLRDVAEVGVTNGRADVRHEAGKRVQTIAMNVSGGTTPSQLVAKARQALAGVALPAGIYVQFSGSAEEEARSRRDLLLHSLVAAVGIALLLWIVLGNARNLLLIAVNLPFALIGGVLALLATRQPLSIGATVGFVTLFGITLRNSIMMLSHYEHLVEQEGETWGEHAAVRGASERLVPILMTSIVTALGLLPLALAADSPGREIEGPMAIVILGGLITSTVLNLLVLPTLALRFGKFGASQLRD